jgi:hypothetical protein
LGSAPLRRFFDFSSAKTRQIKGEADAGAQRPDSQAFAYTSNSNLQTANLTFSVRRDLWLSVGRLSPQTSNLQPHASVRMAEVGNRYRIADLPYQLLNR